MRPPRHREVAVSALPSSTVRRGEPSHAAHWVASLRAVHQLLDEPLVLTDPVALSLLGATAEAALRGEPYPPKETNMTANFDQARVELHCALFLRLVSAPGTTIVCVDGSLWITRDGSPKDVVLSPGQTYLVEDAARVIVTGLGPSQAWVSQPAAERRPATRRSLASLIPLWGRRLVAT